MRELGITRGSPRRITELLADFVEKIRSGLGVDYASISYSTERGAPPTLIECGDRDLVRRLWSSPPPDPERAPPPEGDACIVPLTAEHASFGVLGVARAARPLTEQEWQVLAIAALEASSSLEVLRLQERRRESLLLYARQVTNAQEEERARLARDLHDGPVQVLAGSRADHRPRRAAVRRHARGAPLGRDPA